MSRRHTTAPASLLSLRGSLGCFVMHDQPPELLIRIGGLAKNLDVSASAAMQIAVLEILREQKGVPRLYSEDMSATIAEFYHNVERRAHHAREILGREV